jgi:hypothetical protein
MTRSHRSPSLRRTLAALAVASALGTGTVQATPDTRVSAEIDQLLGNIANSNCTFIRSGQEYSAAEARKHLEMKMNFVLSRLESTEQFIDKLASESSTTGEPYQIRCGNTQTVARTWLNTQLQLVRNQH